MNLTLRFILLCGWMTIFSLGLQAQNFGVDSNIIDYSTPKKYTIAATPVIEGLVSSNIDQNSLIVRCGLTAGTQISVPGEDFSVAIKSLWKMRLFSQVEIVIDKILGDQIFLKIKLTELPKISLYSPAGISKSEREDLTEKLDIIGGVTPYADLSLIHI